MSVDPTGADLQRFLAEDAGGPVVMLNLLRFKPGGGRERYAEYGAAAQAFLDGVGAEVLYAGECSTAVVAADGEAWDALLLVRYPSRQAFLDMISTPEYLAITQLRTEALSAAVLQATSPWPGFAGSEG